MMYYLLIRNHANETVIELNDSKSDKEQKKPDI